MIIVKIIFALFVYDLCKFVLKGSVEFVQLIGWMKGTKHGVSLIKGDVKDD